jgi:NAD+ synthase (glutamine-hydrolysing)
VMPINDISNKFLDTLGHNRELEDITYENTQARTRTEILMNYANMVGGMVQGTGDLSESAQGWCTFNGDHMSMYNPNANIFKTMAKDITRWYADTKASEAVKAVLYDILDTPISPELTGNGDLSQTTEDIIGPYELTEFFHVELQRRKSAPSKIGYLATQATFEKEYTQEEIKHWLDSFLDRYVNSQWKRDVAPNGVQTGSIGNSPRSQLRMAPNTSRDWRK